MRTNIVFAGQTEIILDRNDRKIPIMNKEDGVRDLTSENKVPLQVYYE